MLPLTNNQFVTTQISCCQFVGHRGIVDVALALLTAEAMLREHGRVVIVVYAGADHIRKQALGALGGVSCGWLTVFKRFYNLIK